jgi:hypothetical protein
MSGNTLPSTSMMVRRMGPYVVYVHTQEGPSDDEWDDALEIYKDTTEPEATRTLIFTAGGAPSAAQRARLNVALGPNKTPVAVLTASTMARAAGQPIRWFNPQFRMFEQDDLDGALDHLGIPEADRAAVRNTLLELRAELGILPRRAVGQR